MRGSQRRTADPSVGAAVDHVAARPAPAPCRGRAGLARLDPAWRPPPTLYGADDADFDGAVAEQAVVDAAYVDLAREQAATDAVLAEYPDLSVRLGKDAIAVRELLVHRIEEYARHCGHADLLRECIDGRVGQ
jgi:Protein of unknown function (DUF664)